TGNAGRMAIQVAKRLGAAQVIAAEREATRLAGLPALGADMICDYDELAQAADVDVVLDYVWGSQQHAPWSRCSLPAPTAVRHSRGLRSARSRAPRRRSRRQSSARRGSRSLAVVLAPSLATISSRSFLHSRPPLPMAHSR